MFQQPTVIERTASAPKEPLPVARGYMFFKEYRSTTRTINCEKPEWHKVRKARNLRLYGREWRRGDPKSHKSEVAQEKYSEDELCADAQRYRRAYRAQQIAWIEAEEAKRAEGQSS